MKTFTKKVIAAIATFTLFLGANAATQLTLNDGDTLNGVYEDYEIEIADGATVTFNGATVTHASGGAPAVNCLGDATIILAPGSVNAVTNTVVGYSCVRPAENATLTIRGSGTLMAAGVYNAAAIGSGLSGTCGSIVIEGGTIEAFGGTYGAGIGSGNGGTCGSIVIDGGTVTAQGGDWSAGIGSAHYGTCGDITISGGTVTAEVDRSTSYSVTCTAAIGAGNLGTCGNILISGGTVVADAHSGYSRDDACAIGATYTDSKCGDITITDGITSVTATKGATAQQHIGQGDGSATIGTITYGSHLKQTLSNDDLTVTVEPRYIEIDTVEEFNAIRNDLTGLYRLTADIDLQNVERQPFGWFSGILDGNGHAIRNLNIKPDYDYGTALFKALNNGAVVRNLTLEGGKVQSTSYILGGIAGYVRSGGALIEDCTVDLDIVGGIDQIGGIVGYAYQAGSVTIRRCRSFANIAASGNHVGGLIGQIYDADVLIEDSYSCGKITASGNVGGLVGNKANYTTLAINNSYQRSIISGNSNSDRKLVGNGDSQATITGNPTVIDTLHKGGVRVSTTGAGTGTASYDTATGAIDYEPAPGSFYVETIGEVPSGEFNDVKVQVVFGKEIATVAEFNGITNDLSGIYRLTADLDLDNVARAPFGEFKGLFDGGGHTISNVNISANSENVGLFSGLKGATVRNLSIRGGKISGGSKVGGLAGYATGTSNLIEDCTTDLEVVASGSHAGGVVGYVGDSSAALTLRRCRSLCAVSYGSSHGGGLVGSKYGNYSNLTVESCYAAGSVQGGSNAGGILGQRMWGTVVISNSYWTTEVHGNYNNDTHTVGYGEDSSTIRDTPAILDGFAKNNTFSVRTRGNGTGTAAYVDGEFVATPDEGSVFIRWEGLPPKEGDYNETTVWAVFGKPVASLEDLRAMELGGYYVQTADIDLAGVDNFTGVGFGGYGNTTFRGYYDGGNHEIRNMTIANERGLFRTGVEYSEIRNLRIVDASVTYGNYSSSGVLAPDSSYTTISNVHVVGGSVTATRDRDVGGFVGSITSGIVEDCSSSATVTGGTGQTGGFAGSSSAMMIRRCRATGAVTASGSTVGGFVGNAGGNGVISECYASGVVTAGNQNAGGFVGYDKGGAKISNCYALGAVHATNGYAGGFIGYGYMVTCTNCFSVGEATADSGNVGGFGTNNYLVKFNGSCWDTETSGLDTASGAGEVGRTTAQMKSGVAFEGWDETVWKFSEGLYPRLRAFIPKHTVTWVDEDGSTVLAEGLVEELETPAYDGATPTKAATAQYTYTFAGWTPDLEPVVSNTTYTATYDATVREYTITWQNDDGSTIDTTTVNYGVVPTHADATKAATAQYDYTFAGWGEVVAVTGEATYQATFTPVLRSYTVTWKDDDGTTLGTDTVAYGSTPSRADPSKAATAQYTYTFTGWSPAVAAVTGDATYTATYSETVNTYTITWLDYDGATLKTETLDYGATPTCATPSRADDTYSTYTFLEWMPAVASVTGEATYEATYMMHSKWTGQGTVYEPYTLTTPARITEILALDEGSTPEIFVQTGGDVTSESITANLPTGYAVRTTGTAGVVKVVKILEVVWYDDDGTILRRDEVDAGDMPTYGGTPTKASTAQYDYTFAGWTPEIVEVTESASYTATYTETLRSYTITWLDTDGTQIGTSTVAYGGTPTHAAPASVYTFTGWSPAITSVTGPATYTATFSQTVNLANLTGDYEAAAGDVLNGTTTHKVTIPGGVTVTINGVEIEGAGGGAAPETPSFSDGGETATTKFVKGSDGNWTLTAFAELASGTADGVEELISVYRGTSPGAVTTQVEPTETVTANAVKVKVIVAPTPGAAREFFRIDFGK